MSITLHGFSLSGHSHRVQLALSLMGLPHEVVQVDLKNGAHKSADFLKNLVVRLHGDAVMVKDVIAEAFEVAIDIRLVAFQLAGASA